MIYLILFQSILSKNIKLLHNNKKGIDSYVNTLLYNSCFEELSNQIKSTNEVSLRTHPDTKRVTPIHLTAIAQAPLAAVPTSIDSSNDSKQKWLQYCSYVYISYPYRELSCILFSFSICNRKIGI